MNWDREYLTKANIACVLQRYYESIDEKTYVGPIPAKFLISDLRHALLAAQAVPFEQCKFDTEFILAELKRFKRDYQRCYEGSEVKANLKAEFMKLKEAFEDVIIDFDDTEGTC